MHRMLDNAHLAVSGRFSGTLTLPDGTVVDQTTTPTMKPGPLPFILKFDVSSDTGVGTGTTGWFKQIDLGYEGGATVHSVDGDASGNFIIAMEGCASWTASVVGCRYGGTYPNCASRAAPRTGAQQISASLALSYALARLRLLWLYHDGRRRGLRLLREAAVRRRRVRALFEGDAHPGHPVPSDRRWQRLLRLPSSRGLPIWSLNPRPQRTI